MHLLGQLLVALLLLLGGLLVADGLDAGLARGLLLVLELILLGLHGGAGNALLVALFVRGKTGSRAEGLFGLVPLFA